MQGTGEYSVIGFAAYKGTKLLMMCKKIGATRRPARLVSPQSTRGVFFI